MLTLSTFKLQLDNLHFFELLYYTTTFTIKIKIMQRLITVSIDTTQLIKIPNDPFSINDVDSVNDLLADGWEIEEWDFLKEDDGDGKILLLITLNDEMKFSDEDDIFDEDFEEDEDDDEEDIEEERKL